MPDLLTRVSLFPISLWAAFGVWLAPLPTRGDVIIPVVSTADSGAGSLREAVSQANAVPPDTAVIIDLVVLQGITAPAAPVIELTSGPLALLRGMSIMANPGPARPVLRGAASGRRLIIIGQAATGTVTLAHLVLENGFDAGRGGAIHYEQGASSTGPLTLALQGCELRGNKVGSTTSGQTATYGGAVFFLGRGSNPHTPVLTIANCRFEDNQALGFEGTTPMPRGAAVYAESALVTVNDTTFSGHFNNSPVGAFGGTLVIATCGQTATLARCVFTGNNSMGGGGGEPPDLRQPVSVLGDFPGCVSF